MIHLDKDPTLQTLFVQEALKARGHYTGDLDNWPGPETTRALAAAVAEVKSAIMPPPTTNLSLDERSMKTIATLDPKAHGIFLRLAAIGKTVAMQHGCNYVAIAGNRTWAEQDALYAKGRTAPGPKVTNAKGGQSNHNFGIAADFGVFRAGKYLDSDEPKTAEMIHRATAAAAKAERLPIEWGGDWASFKDFPHFEIKTIYTTTAAKRARFQQYGSVLV